MVAYDLETFNNIKCVPYANCIYTLSKNSGKNNRDKAEREYEKCREHCIVFKVTDSNNDHVLQLKGEARRVNNKIVKYNLYILAHNGSGFDSYIVLNNFPQWPTVVSFIKNGSSIVSLKIFNGFVDQKKRILQKVHFRFGRVHVIISLKNTGISYSLQKSVFDLETLNTDRAIPYANCMYRPNKFSGKFIRDITEREYEKCRKDCIVFKGTDSVNEMLDYVLQSKGEAKKN